MTTEAAEARSEREPEQVSHIDQPAELAFFSVIVTLCGPGLVLAWFHFQIYFERFCNRHSTAGYDVDPLHDAYLKLIFFFTTVGWPLLALGGILLGLIAARRGLADGRRGLVVVATVACCLGLLSLLWWGFGTSWLQYWLYNPLSAQL